MSGEPVIYTVDALPPLEDGTDGWAKQLPEANVAACLMTETRDMKAPWGLLTGIAGKHYHQVSTLANEDGVIDEFPNDGFESDYSVIRELRPNDDQRGDRLFEIYGRSAKVVLAYKAKPIVVHGRVSEFCQFKTSESRDGKIHDCPPGSVIVSNLEKTRGWAIGPTDFKRLYGDKIWKDFPPLT
jgi:hypothetical protein